MWSRIGRLKRHTMPKLTKGNSIFGAGASPGIMACIAGRLLCDTFLCSRDLLKEVSYCHNVLLKFLHAKRMQCWAICFLQVSYSLTQLAKNQLHKDRKEISPQDIPSMFQTVESLIELVGSHVYLIFSYILFSGNGSLDSHGFVSVVPYGRLLNLIVSLLFVVYS